MRKGKAMRKGVEEVSYYIDLNTISLAKFKKKLKNMWLLKSQKILGENIEKNISILANLGIKNLEQLRLRLKSKLDVAKFSEESGLSIEYLTLLRREVNSYLPKPLNFKDIPDIDDSIIEKLLNLGIKNSKQLFPFILNKNLRNEFSQKSGLSSDETNELTAFTDLARLKWVGPKFSKLLIEAGFNSVEKVKNTDINIFLEKLQSTNENNKSYKSSYKNEDIVKWVKQVLPETPIVIEF